jgi:predicted DNA-binding antitoxin AbrB/MazE fold protein
MTLKIEATYENGVFVPKERPALADHEHVQLTVETVSARDAAPMLPSRRRRRIRIDPSLARDIAARAEFTDNRD